MRDGAVGTTRKEVVTLFVHAVAFRVRACITNSIAARYLHLEEHGNTIEIGPWRYDKVVVNRNGMGKGYSRSRRGAQEACG